MEAKTDANAKDTKPPAVAYVHTTGMSAFLESLRISLLVTTYQAQRIMTFSPNGAKLFMLMRVFERPTGMAKNDRELALITKRQVWWFTPVEHLRDKDGNLLPHDLYLSPRRSHVTGDILGHDAAYAGDELYIVNTRFSCLCTISEGSSFVPVWKPAFIDHLVAEDRCHLNGLVVDANGPRFVSALGTSNTKEGWRPTKANGGVVIDVRSNEIVSRGISMPHSPRWYQDKLWLLESGLGELQTVDLASGKRTTVAKLPGYLRGLAFHDHYAFVGLCQIRDKENFGGLPIEQGANELKCAIHVVDLRTGRSVEFIEFTRGIEELFEIQVLAGVRNPHILGFEEDTVDGLYVFDE